MVKPVFVSYAKHVGRPAGKFIRSVQSKAREVEKYLKSGIGKEFLKYFNNK